MKNNGAGQYFHAFLAIMNLVITELISRDIKIYDADNREYYIEKIEYCSDDDKIIFVTEEDKPLLKQLSIYDNIINLTSENSDLKIQIEDLKKLNDENRKVIGILSNQLEGMINENENQNIGTSEQHQ